MQSPDEYFLTLSLTALRIKTQQQHSNFFLIYDVLLNFTFITKAFTGL